jgi:hypothetical protein
MVQYLQVDILGSLDAQAKASALAGYSFGNIRLVGLGQDDLGSREMLEGGCVFLGVADSVPQRRIGSRTMQEDCV